MLLAIITIYAFIKGLYYIELVLCGTLLLDNSRVYI